MKEEKEQDKAATMLQSISRKKAAQKRVTEMKAMQNRSKEETAPMEGKEIVSTDQAVVQQLTQEAVKNAVSEVMMTSTALVSQKSDSVNKADDANEVAQTLVTQIALEATKSAVEQMGDTRTHVQTVDTMGAATASVEEKVGDLVTVSKLAEGQIDAAQAVTETAVTNMNEDQINNAQAAVEETTDDARSTLTDMVTSAEEHLGTTKDGSLSLITEHNDALNEALNTSVPSPKSMMRPGTGTTDISSLSGYSAHEGIGEEKSIISDFSIISFDYKRAANVLDGYKEKIGNVEAMQQLVTELMELTRHVKYDSEDSASHFENVQDGAGIALVMDILIHYSSVKSPESDNLLKHTFTLIKQVEQDEGACRSLVEHNIHQLLKVLTRRFRRSEDDGLKTTLNTIITTLQQYA